MLKTIIWQQYALNEKSVDSISLSVQTYLERLGTERRNIQRIRLTIEELILRIIEGTEDINSITVGIGKSFGHHVLKIQYGGDRFDPTEDTEEKNGLLADIKCLAISFTPYR